jgi:hypothetical protein
VDADGRRYFRPRRVRFRTIGISAAELFQAGWLKYDAPLAPPYRAGNANPSHREIREFATRASERFQEFWYRVFDVAMARALAGREVDVFLCRPFYRPNTFFDTGIPDDQSLSSVPPQLHAKIHAEYIRSRETPTRRRIYYLSNYLEDITGDLIEALEPYRAFWRLKEKRRELLERITATHAELKTALLPPPVRDRLRGEIDRRLLTHLDELAAARAERGISVAAVRSLVHRRRAEDLRVLTNNERNLLFAAPPGEVRIAENLRAMNESLELLDRCLARSRSAAGYSSAAHRLDLRQARLNYMLRQRSGAPRDPATARSLAERRARYMKLFLERLKDVSLFTDGVRGKHETPERILVRLTALRILGKLVMNSGVPAPNRRESPGSPGQSDDQRLSTELQNLFDDWNGCHASESDGGAHADSRDAALQDLETLRGVPGILSGLRRAEAEIAAYYESYSEPNAKKTERADHASNPESAAPNMNLNSHGAGSDDGAKAGESPEMYAGAGRALRIDEHLRVGDPYDETQILKAARQLVFQRLRPVRRTANHYSLNPGHRHGAVTLNPVMKLWKDRPEYTREGPELIRLEMNTRSTVDCLLDLVSLADPELRTREVRREKILREIRGPENLDNLLVLLLPGSCYSLREVHRLDFPEFRGRVLGETRNPTELGVDPREDSLLTGAWYQKLNHTLYYPIGGDHGRLLRLIWNSARAPGPPAFLFALGQFVHDCLEDHLVYFKTAEKTFRECVEDYYLQEDRVRKNRGERMGRRRPDNSRAGVRFMFAILYARLTMEALTGSSQSHFRHPPTETWMMRHLNLPVLNRADRGRFIEIRTAARACIESASAEGLGPTSS